MSLNRERERTRLQEKLDAYYPTENHRRALCFMNTLAMAILLTLALGKDPQEGFDFQNEMHAELYDRALVALEVCGYVTIKEDRFAELTKNGTAFAKVILDS